MHDVVIMFVVCCFSASFMLRKGINILFFTLVWDGIPWKSTWMEKLVEVDPKENTQDDHKLYGWCNNHICI